MLEQRRPDILEEAEKRFTLSRRHTITAEVKAQTKAYKETFRDMDNDQAFLPLEQKFIEFVDERIDTLQDMVRTLSQWATSKQAGIDPKTVSAQGTEIWRAQWQQRIAMVNTLIDALWPTAEKDLERWIDKQTTIKTKLRSVSSSTSAVSRRATKGRPNSTSGSTLRTSTSTPT